MGSIRRGNVCSAFRQGLLYFLLVCYTFGRGLLYLLCGLLYYTLAANDLKQTGIICFLEENTTSGTEVQGSSIVVRIMKY